jgi:hypothetical protein
MKFLPALLILCLSCPLLASNLTRKGYELVDCAHSSHQRFNESIQKSLSNNKTGLSWNSPNCQIFMTEAILPKNFRRTELRVTDSLVAIVYNKFKKVLVCLPNKPQRKRNTIFCAPIPVR